MDAEQANEIKAAIAAEGEKFRQAIAHAMHRGHIDETVEIAARISGCALVIDVLDEIIEQENNKKGW